MFTSSSLVYPRIGNLLVQGNDTREITMDNVGGFFTRKVYSPPSWATHLNPIPSHTYSLGHLPTPIHKWNLPGLPKDTEVWIKRDDLTGMQLSGNKVRKLEFLMADAKEKEADCIITIGGIQSNHCRATAVAARYLGLDSYLILRTSKALVEQDPGLTGNLLVERMVGAHVDLVSKEEYAKIGSVTLGNLLRDKLLSKGRKPYVIPVGGSNSLGTWGYIEAIREIEQQIQLEFQGTGFTDIVVACGSGGSTAGLALGSWLGKLKAKVHAFAVCDDPGYFYDYVQGLLDGLNAGVDSRSLVYIEDVQFCSTRCRYLELVRERNCATNRIGVVGLEPIVCTGGFSGTLKPEAKGLGYAINTSEELKLVKEIAEATGVILDPVYSGKAACRMLKDMEKNPNKWAGRKVLFIHTGGLLGLFDKADQIMPLVQRWQKMDIDQTVPRKDGAGKMF